MRFQRLAALPPVCALVLLAGCASDPQPYQSYLSRRTPGGSPAPAAKPPAFTTVGDVRVREIHLSPQDPVDETTQIQLLGIGPDLTTRILTRKGEVLTGRPGDFFNSPELGATGLQLLTASALTGDALFEQRLRP
jgi:hypothetical protein